MLSMMTDERRAETREGGGPMRYSIERTDAERTQSAIVLRLQDEGWSPAEGQVEIGTDEAGRHADLDRLRYWRIVEFEPHRLGRSYRTLETLLAR